MGAPHARSRPAACFVFSLWIGNHRVFAPRRSSEVAHRKRAMFSFLASPAAVQRLG